MKAILAAAVAVGTLSMPLTAANAASVTINQNGVTVHADDHHDMRDHRYHRPVCRYETVKKWYHHHLVYEKVRVCH